MPNCKHKPSESSRGVAVCDIRAEIKNRNGSLRWWCRVHGQEAWRPDGAPMEQCPGAFYDPVLDSDVLDLDLAADEVGIWGALPPAIAIGTVDEEPAGVHVHCRRLGQGRKAIDGTFQMVRVRNGEHEVLIEATAAAAFSISQLLDQPLVALRCPKPGCGAVHLDELQFATFGHRKHQCNKCGRPFYDSQGPSTSNPLAEAHQNLGLPERRSATPPGRAVRLRSEEFGGIAIWPSNPSIVWNSNRSEDLGLHVHAWDHAGELVIDETYASVVLDGQLLDESQVKLLCALRELAGSSDQITSASCEHCGEPLVSRPLDTSPLIPTTRHACSECGGETRTTRRRFLHPLAEQYR